MFVIMCRESLGGPVSWRSLHRTECRPHQILMAATEGLTITQQPEHNEVAEAIDEFLLRDRFDELALTDQRKYEAWYATYLTSAALAAGGEPVEYAYANFAPSMSDIRITVFTPKLVMVAHIDTEFDGVPVVRTIPRRSLQTMELSASERIDSRDRRSHEWPGSIVLKLHYQDLKDPIEIVGEGVNVYRVSEPSALVRLVKALSADLS